MDAEQRFFNKVAPEPNSGCWLWTGSCIEDGYGQFWFEGTNVRAHRWAYEFLVEPIPEGLQIDHLCRIRSCVNPSHMEVVTHQINLLRGHGTRAENRLTPERLYICHKKNTVISSADKRAKDIHDAEVRGMMRAAGIARLYADENLTMAGESILADPVLSGELSAAAHKKSKSVQIDGTIYSASYHAAKNIAEAIMSAATQED